ncbi:MAG: glycosyltransferase family 2 protein [Proteobacteria bacterium]|nr:MAG: glycosyltransferase family 2 protein [Pseudomonadota bacterium]
MVKISVIMATYNGGKYLSQQLDSILNQTVLVDEIIIVDDVSKDNTIDIINQYSQKFKTINFVQNEKNIGVVKTFEKAISLSHGEYILFADQDDVWFNNKVETLISVIGDNWLIYSDTVVTDENLNVICQSGFVRYESGREFITLFDYLMGNNVTGCTIMITRDLLNHALPFPELKVMYHDHYLAIVAKKFDKLVKFKQPLVYYRQHGCNSSSGFIHIPYNKIINNSKNMSNDLINISKTILFDYENSNNIIYAINFYKAMAHERYPDIGLLKLLYGKMQTRMFFWFIRMACLSKWFASFNYNLSPLKLKIKQWFNNVK